MEQLLGSALLDYIAIDLKALPEDYPTVCQGDFLKTEQTLTLLSRQTVPFELRTTLYPGLSLDQLRRLLQLLPPVPRWRLNYFRMPATYRSEDQGRDVYKRQP